LEIQQLSRFLAMVLHSMLALIVVLSIIRPSSAACYSRNGTEITAEDYQPCSNLANTHSMCCALTARSSADLCLPSGLCLGEPTLLEEERFGERAAQIPLGKIRLVTAQYVILQVCQNMMIVVF